MIYGIGIDGAELDRIERALTRSESFVKKVLTANELKIFERLRPKKQVDFVAGRWAAKEAFSKAYGTGFVGLQPLDMEILHEASGKPYFSKSPWTKGPVQLSITDTRTEAMAVVTLEISEEVGK